MAGPFFLTPKFPQNSAELFGFDELPPALGVANAYQMVPLRGGRSVQVKTDGEPFAIFSMAPSIATLIELPSGNPAPGNRLVFRTPQSVENIFIKGSKQGLTQVVIVKLADGAPTSNLVVSVKSLVTMPLSLFFLTDSIHTGGKEKGFDEMLSIISDVKKIYLNQANIKLIDRGTFLAELGIIGDFGLPILQEERSAVINGDLNQAPFDFFNKTFESSTRFNVVLAWEMRQNRELTKRIGGLAPTPGNFCVIDPFVENNLVTTRIAHEMLHSTGLGHPIGRTDVLMAEKEGPNWRMLRAEIDHINSTGLTFFIDPQFL